MLRQTAFHAATRRPSRFSIAGGTFLAALCVASVLGNALGPSHGAERREVAVSAVEPAIEVNRALKGNRLRVIVRPDGGEPAGVQIPRNPTRGLPDGCESAFGPILPETKPARCVT
jgi:hypothetical protein